MTAPAPPRTDPAASMSLLSGLMADAVHSDYDDPPAPGSPGGPPPASRRGWQATAVLAGVAVAVLLTVAVLQTRDAAPQVASRRAALVDRVVLATGANQELDARIRSLRQEVAQAEAEAVADSATGQALAERAAGLAAQAQYTEVSGPGVVITLQDAEDPSPSEADLGRVLDRDLQLVVNGLWRAGATAVAINDHRLSARTAIRSAGGAILVDYRPLLPPYRVAAVGADDLAARFESSDAGRDLRGLGDDYGLRWSLEPAVPTLPPADSALPQLATVPEPAP